MKLKSLIPWTALVFLLGVVGCAKQSPTQPSATATDAAAAASSATATVVIQGITFSRPQPVTPLANAQIKYADQPVTLVVRNALSTGPATRTYTFEVATDSAFNNIVYSKSGVAEGSGGQTSVTIDKLAGSTTYYWRARAETGQNGPYFVARTFVMGPPVTLSTPVLAAPGSNATVSATPALTVNNIAVTGPAGPIFYRYDVSDSSAFDNILFTATVPQQQGASTTASVTTILKSGPTYWWRVQASDPSDGLTTPYSVANPFTVVVFSWTQASIVSSPYDLASWGETAHITSVVFTSDAFLVDFDLRDGPNRWPDTPFGSGSIEYTLGICGNLNSHWYCSAAVQFWYGRDLGASGPPWRVAQDWFYDPARWGPMTGYQPADGETVGLFVCAGNCRNNTAGDNSYVKERSDLALVPWSNEGGTSYTFSAAKQPLQITVKK